MSNAYNNAVLDEQLKTLPETELTVTLTADDVARLYAILGECDYETVGLNPLHRDLSVFLDANGGERDYEVAVRDDGCICLRAAGRES